MAEAKQVVDSAQSPEVTEQKDSGKEPELNSLLAEWDNKVSESFVPPPEDAEQIPRDPEEIAAFEKRIESLEGDNSALKAEKGELTERAEQFEQTEALVEREALRIDQHDHDQLVKRLASEIGITERVAKMEIRKWFEEDETHLTLADNRADNPDDFEAAIGSMMADLQDKHPQRENHRGLAHAYRIAHSAQVVGRSYGETDYGNFSEMNDHQFAVASEEVFADMRSGKLRAESSGPRGGCLRTGPS